MEPEIAINGVTYVRQRPLSDDDVRIVVLHRGHVVVGRYERSGDDVVVRHASVIRVWGTTRGLGEIASGGPTPKTVLDACGTVRVHALAVIFTLDCEGQKWASKLT
jgi:hypothetical protein